MKNKITVIKYVLCHQPKKPGSDIHVLFEEVKEIGARIKFLHDSLENFTGRENFSKRRDMILESQKLNEDLGLKLLEILKHRDPHMKPIPAR